MPMTLLYLCDAQQSLAAALDIINTFGRYSGVRINWDKSVLFPLIHIAPPLNFSGASRSGIFL